MSISRPKLLFLTRVFPPVAGVGAVRTWNLAKHMARQGWDVIVVTPHPFLWRRLEHPEKVARDMEREGIRGIFTDHTWRSLTPELKCWNKGPGWVMGGVCRRIARRFSIDRGIGWISPAERACSHIAPKDVDLILASGPPFSGFVLAQRLSKRLGKPYILDYRDLWSKNFYRPLPAVEKMEAKILTGSSGAITVSPSWGQIMEEQFGVDGKMEVVTNGYDPQDLSAVKAHRFSDFAMVYAGSFRPPKRVVTPIMATLQKIGARDTHKVSFHYYGEDSDHVKEEARNHGVMDSVILHGQVPREEALSALKGANISVVITSVSDQERSEDNGMIPAKLYECLGLGNCVLLVGPRNSDAGRILNETGGGRSFTATEIDAIASYVVDRVNNNTRRFRTSPELYSWPHIAKRLDETLRNIAFPNISTGKQPNNDKCRALKVG